MFKVRPFPLHSFRQRLLERASATRNQITQQIKRSRVRQRHQTMARSSRLEPFGAIVQLLRPRALVFVDRAKARALKIGAADAWARWSPSEDGELGKSTLTAPLEAHLQLTNRCAAGCTGCYTAATPTGGSAELGPDEWKHALNRLADIGVFHLALGGGESADLPWLGEIARYARELGMIPNLTTSGLSNIENVLSAVDQFGQINISMDGIGDRYAEVRGFDGFARADQSLRKLRERKREVGINVVVTRTNFAHLDELFAYAKKRRLNEVELLRFKPSGRGARAYAKFRCTDEQHRALLPTVLQATKKHRIRTKLDCSYTPMIACHSPDHELMRALAVYGCVGGDFLIGAKANGSMTACSFAEVLPGLPKVGEIQAYWQTDNAFGDFRRWQGEGEPCQSCNYQSLCRGGCKAVSRHLTGDQRSPDPECPTVIAHAAIAHTKQQAGSTASTQPPTRQRLPVVR